MTEPSRDTPTQDDPAATALARRRRSTLLNHLIAYFAVLVVLVPVNFLTTPDHPWFIYPMVGWMAPLAAHVAWVMGLFDRRA